MILSKIPAVPPKDIKKKDIEKKLDEYGRELAQWQEKLFAQKEKSLLIILQGMDASGKSSTVRDVFKDVNPMGIITKSYKKPTEEEFAHDFLWRIHKHVPAKGLISIFDRSHYEEVLIQRVHGWIDEEKVKQRFEHINNFERLLVQEANTTILKFYLHISKEDQEKELTERKTDPTKFWKHNDNDWEERKLWDEYRAAYEDVFKNCGPEIPWHIIPADRSWYRKYMVAKTIVETLRNMDLDWPKVEV